MRFPREIEAEETAINLTSVLDMMFILVIFLLTTATYQEEEFDQEVNLPQASAQAPLGATSKLMVVNVRKDGQYVVVNRVVPLDELRKIVQSAVARNPQQTVLVRGDRAATHGRVADAIAACYQAGVRKANIAYEWKT